MEEDEKENENIREANVPSSDVTGNDVESSEKCGETENNTNDSENAVDNSHDTVISPEKDEEADEITDRTMHSSSKDSGIDQSNG